MLKLYEMKKHSLLIFFLAILFSGNLFSQNERRIDYGISEIDPSVVMMAGQAQINARNARYFQLDVAQLEAQLNGIANREVAGSGFIARILLPHPDGTLKSYRASENNTLHPELRANFPGIHTYDASGSDFTAFAKWDITPHGLHAMIMIPGESTIFIDPVIQGNRDYYIVYRKKDFQTDKLFDCSFEAFGSASKALPEGNIEALTFGTCELRTYRLALAATGEYTVFHGGTVPLALAAQATTMNRVNGVYERDMAITMVMVPNNNVIVYTNGGTDPYANGNAGTMINQNQTNCDAQIQSANYDIGHVFGTNSGGLAGLGVVCAGGNKARGVTGSNAPIGDPFDIDYVAHEMGHQFGANHTQNNNCNRNNPTAMEPGSASTIMGYAGICAPNVQPNSDDHFHGVSLGEISVEILSGGHTCEVITALANTAPTITATNGNVTVPVSTPFALTATVIDPDGDPVSYNWEQMNNQVSTQPPVATSTGGPNFRSLPSSSNPTRYFPSLSSLATNGPYTWEVLPSVSRTMNFRVTVRDNSPGPGGCNDYTDVTVTTHAGSGPFIVQYPSATGITWNGNSTETVTWDVANTDVAPVACDLVDIYLSTDGGLSYPTLIANDVPNDGSHQITVPNTATTTARIMVICANGTFFDVSNNNFTIVAATFDFTQSVVNSSVSICQPDNATYDINIGQIGGYSDPVTLSVSGLSGGLTSSFTTNPVVPIGTSVLTISNTGSVAPGTYNFVLTGISTSGTKNSNLTLIIADGSPSAVNLTAPGNGSTGVSVSETMTWTVASGSGITYEIDIATDAGFTAIVDQASGLTVTNYTSAALLPSTTYFWRVRAVTGCGQSPWSSVFNFTTSNCSTLASSDVGQSTNVASFDSELIVSSSGTITDISVIDLDISHPWVGDLGAILTSPQGTTVQLFDGPGIPASQYGCDEDDMLVSFSDAAALTATDLENACGATVPSIAGTYQSMDALSAFIGEEMNGTWILTVFDSYTAGDVGTLNGWSLNICAAGPGPCADPDLPVLTGDSDVCENEDVELFISGNLNDADEWFIYSGSCGGTLIGSTSTGSFFISAPVGSTTYYVRGEDGSGCVNEASLSCGEFTINVTALPTVTLSPFADVCLDATPFSLSGGSPAGGDYSGPGVSGGNFDPSVAGLGTHQIVYNYTDGNGCSSDDQETITVNDCAGLEDMDAIVVLMYPNPTNGFLTISSESILIASVLIWDAAGRLVFDTDVNALNAEISVQDLASGNYNVQIKMSNETIAWKRLIKE